MGEAADPGRPGSDRVRGWAGHRLDEITGRRVGRVVGALADPDGGARWLVARMGRFGHFTLVPARDAVEGAGRVWVPYDRDRIRSAPRVEPDATPDAATERALADHYGVGADGAER